MASEAQIQEAGRVLRAGGTVAFATETVYGLGANALDARAVAKVFAAKARPSFDPLIVHVAEAAAAWSLVDLEALPAEVRALPGVLAAAFWPGPLTLVLPKRATLAPGVVGRGGIFWGVGRRGEDVDLERGGEAEGVEKRGDAGTRMRSEARTPRGPGGEFSGEEFRAGVPGVVTAGLGTVGVRVPGHGGARAMLRAAGVPVAAPSANPFGGISPTRAEHVTVPCDVLLDGGPCATGVESTVVTVVGGAQDEGGAHGGGVVVLRLGGVSVEALESVVKARQEGWGVWWNRVTEGRGDERNGGGLMSPGTTLKHYAPRTPLRLVEEGGAAAAAARVQSERQLGRVGVLSLRGSGFGSPDPAAGPTGSKDQGTLAGEVVVEVLDAGGDLTAAAARLFEALHRLDAAGLELIVAETVPEVGLGRAINDRLRRAAARE